MGSPARHELWFILAGVIVVIADIAVIYLFTTTPTTPPGFTYVMTVTLGGCIGISYLYTVRRYLLTSTETATGPNDSALGQAAELVVSVTVLGPITVLLGTVGGLFLELIARIGGPDPVTDNSEPWRVRLRRWPKRNRAFLRSKGRESVPMTP